jgi:hypothetical protein
MTEKKITFTSKSAEANAEQWILNTEPITFEVFYMNVHNN